MEKKPLLEIHNLVKEYPIGKKTLTAVNQFNLSIYPGETLGLVGESGCGKSTVGKTILRLEEPTSGKVIYDGIDLTSLPQKQLKQIRRRMQIVFQDPYASLNPRMTVKDIVGEAFDIHHLPGKKHRVAELLKLVGLNPNLMSRFPHEFSGGQRQRIGIARALAVNPEFIICDEPISALDVSIQAQVVNLLKQLQRQMGLTYLFIAHDLSMIKYISDRVAVMYLGELVELGSSQSIYETPHHPYTKALLSAIPIPDPVIEKKRQKIIMTGEMPNPMQPRKGCPFASRCTQATSKCLQEKPPWKEVKPGHFTACHLF